jgi:hypothetical protein
MRPGLNHDSTLKIGYREISVGKNAGTVGKLIGKKSGSDGPFTEGGDAVRCREILRQPWVVV